MTSHGRSALLPSPTSVLGRLPPALRRHLLLEQLAHAVLTTVEFFPITAAIDRIDTYAATACSLSARIKREFLRVYREAGIRAASGRVRRLAARTAFVNVHFVFTCWSAVRVAVTVIERSANRLAFSAVKRAVRPFASDLRHYTEGRDHLEHLDERMPGGRKEAVMNPRVYGGLNDGEIFQFGNGKWNVSVKSSERLRKLGAELRMALVADLLDLGARRTPDDLTRYLNRVARDVQTQALTRRVTRALARGGIG